MMPLSGESLLFQFHILQYFKATFVFFLLIPSMFKNVQCGTLKKPERVGRVVPGVLAVLSAVPSLRQGGRLGVYL